MRTVEIWQRFARKPGGKWAFSRLVGLKAPYSASIKPLFHELRSEYCELSIRKRRSVLNHIGTVHAIAMCNMAELAAGMMTEATIPPTHRWIPKAMTVEYLKKATTDLTAVATPESKPDWSTPGEYKVNVAVRNRAGEQVFRAVITMWVSPKKGD